MTPAAKPPKPTEKPSARTPTAAAKRRALAIYAALLERYPDAHCALHHRTPFELLIATILSAQATDAGVNKATPGLFAAYPSPAALAAATPEAVEPLIQSIGLYRNKAKAIVSAARTIVERFGGEVPSRMDDLLTLRGVARKTANVVLGNAFGLNEGVVVDTHVERLAKRFGLAPEGANVAQVERRLMALFPRETWCMLSHLLIWHGRQACKARGAACAEDEICRRWCSNAKAPRAGRTLRA